MSKKRGRPPLSTSALLLRNAFAVALQQKIGSARGAQTRAAERLGISRQAVSLYVNGKATPETELLRRACEVLDLSFDAGPARIDSTSVGRPSKPLVVPQQLPLFQALQRVSDRQLRVHVLKKTHQSLDLSVSIDFGSAAKR